MTKILQTIYEGYVFKSCTSVNLTPERKKLSLSKSNEL